MVNLESADDRFARINKQLHRSFTSFNKALQKTKQLPPEIIGIIQKSVAFSALQSLLQKTPVGNPSLWKDPSAAPKGYVGGQAKANWQVGIGKAPKGTVKGADKDGSATLEKQKAVLGFIPPYSIVFIVNNIDYIIWLEDGHSSQAPAGMMKVTLAELESQLDAALRDL